MILEFSVENFKSIKDKATLSFEATSDTTNEDVHVVEIDNLRILKIGAIYGANASGKTNLLLALEFLRDFIINSSTTLRPNEENFFIPFLFDNDGKNNPGIFRLSFFIEQIKYEYELHLDSQIVLNEKLYYSPKGQRKRIYERTFDRNINQYTYLWGSTIRIDEKLVEKSRKNIPFLSSIVQLVDHSELKRVYDWFEGSIMPMIHPGNQGLINFTMNRIDLNSESKKTILDILAIADMGNVIDIDIESNEIPDEILKNLDDKIKNSVRTSTGKYIIKNTLLMHQYNNLVIPLVLDSESKGTQRYFELAGPLEILKNENIFLSMDELESSLHSELQEFILTYFLKHSKPQSQLLFTTHNVQLMDSSLLRRDEIWFAEKNNNTGGSEYYSLSDIKGTRKEGSFRKQYLAGKYGALPVLKNFQEED
ncbi:MAG: AAA family ATPase [Spirochaetales bacterium]|nr:AAA family ATPase [Spirochaetales bacterium]